jgi:leucyl/phenylalanyl-tRNA--protein transferase
MPSMPIVQLDETLLFPPVELAEPEGLLAIGGDLSPERLILAYRSGIFPWYEGKQILWWSPDPRFVLFPNELQVSKSMKALIKKETFQFTTNKSFEQVINQCKKVKREGQRGTWITNDMLEAYQLLHQKGIAQSAEAWQEGELVGGLYGIRMGKLFFGESMFSTSSNASKFAFIKYVEQLAAEGVVLIDCQVHTSHLESLGARMISRQRFLEVVSQNC